MMSETQFKLARRAVAWKGWRWMPGMCGKHRHCWPIRVLVRDDGEGSEEYVVRPGPDGNEIQCIDECGVMGSFPDADGSPYPVVPDLDDPATLGCIEFGLLAGLGATLHRAPDGWRVIRNGGSWLLEESDGTKPDLNDRAHAAILALEMAGQAS